jgi:hypothetical protein
MVVEARLQQFNINRKKRSGHGAAGRVILTMQLGPLWSEPFGLDRFQAEDYTGSRVNRSSNRTGDKYPSAECNLRVL